MRPDIDIQLCSGCHISYLEAQAFNRDDVLHFFFSHNVFAKCVHCTTCKRIVNVDSKRLRYRCSKWYTLKKKGRSRCTFLLSVASGTFTDGAHIPLDIIFKLTSIALFSIPPRPTSLSNEFKLSGATLVRWFLSIKEVFIDAVSRNTEKLGGEGQIIELDEAKCSKHKRSVHPWDWVYGGIDRTSRQTFLTVSEHRNAAALRHIILEKVNPGTIIVTNCLKYYSGEVFKSLSESHGFTFLKPQHSALADTIKRQWREVCREIHLKVQPRSVDNYAMYLFKSKYSEPTERLHAYFVAAGELYPPKIKRYRGEYILKME